MALRMFVLAAGLIALATPALAFESESSETTLPMASSASATAALALPEPDGVSAALPHSEMSRQGALALPEPETAPLEPYHNCHASGDDTVYLTN